MAYHTRQIEKGEFGEISKIREEMEELLDADEQNCKVMVLIELSDMLGAIDGYLKRHHSSMSMDDLLLMAKITSSAFIDGSRK